MCSATCVFRFGRLLAACLGLLIASLSAASTTEIACGSPAGGGGGHAWLIRLEPGGMVLIWHLPPRASGSTSGRTRIAGEAGSMPIAAAAVGARLYLVFDDKPAAPPAKPRQVLSMSAVPTDEWGRWATRPSGKFETAPSLRADGKILSAIGSDGAPWMLFHGLREDGDSPFRLELVRLGPGGWESIGLPADAQELARAATQIEGAVVSMSLSWHLVATPEGVGLIAVNPSGVPFGASADVETTGPIAMWRCHRSAEPGVRWKRSSLALPEQQRLESLSICVSGDRIVAALPGPLQTLSLFARPLQDESPLLTRLVTLEAVQTPYSLAALDADGIAAVFYAEPAGGDAVGRSLSARMIAEVSTRTGRIMYQGRLIGIAPVAPSDFRLMTVLMFLVVGSVILFVARPPGDAPEVHLPPQCALAGPVRRGIAMGIDVIIGLFLAATVWRVPIDSLVTPEWWGAAEAWSVCMTALVLLVCGCSLCEAFAGKTVGKVLCGCEVVSTRKGAEARDGLRPAFSAALLRNLLKWVVPIVALVGALDPTRRHRADEWSGTAVIVRFSEEPEEF